MLVLRPQYLGGEEQATFSAREVQDTQEKPWNL
jgi:hypothetical protein